MSGLATYGANAGLSDLQKINFIYGSNGAGKTSISRAIAATASDEGADGRVIWDKGVALNALVYNSDFIERNFTIVADLKGVFTLGEDQQETLTKIEAAKIELGKLSVRLENQRHTLYGDETTPSKEADKSALGRALKDKCWAQKVKHDDKFKKAFEGLRASSDRFRDRVLAEQLSNKAPLLPYEDLIVKAETLYGDEPQLVPLIPGVQHPQISNLEKSALLAKKIIGKEDVDIAKLISKLNNSDWVRQGIKYFNQSEGSCPFCQQSTSDSFAASLAEYFDETFEAETSALSKLLSDYKLAVEQLLQAAQGVADSSPRFLALDKYKLSLELLTSKLFANIQRIDGKVTQPSVAVALEATGDLVVEIQGLISAANEKAKAHNAIVNNFSAEQAALTSGVWRYILEELKLDLTSHKEQVDKIDKTIAALSTQIEKTQGELADKDREIKELEKKTTSVEPTVVAINSLLFSFGFKGFKLAVTADGKSYSLIRPDGKDAKKTLSEGEKSFVTFLYFYHLIKGSPTPSGVTESRVVAIDDPVSSLDSDILFIVGSLIKRLFDEVRMKGSGLKQIFILTHNVYFHKEVSFNMARVKEALAEESFWIVRKPDGESVIERHNYNPIKTSYELLWAELKRSDISSLTIQNTMRRILENYFKILGGVKFDELIDKFEGQEKLICKSLISWVNDGSHFVHDDLYLSMDQAMVNKYVAVFFRIFKKSEHLPHYKMMMGDSFVDYDAADRLVEEGAAAQDAHTMENIGLQVKPPAANGSDQDDVPF
ncbi:AAA family ATPase [Pseudomonas sp. QL9]|uniref:AAA family ATPase n=1 Tax=Pseudomonas sp. QL9 TaxID=3242725 RepID=UPI00352BACDE